MAANLVTSRIATWSRWRTDGCGVCWALPEHSGCVPWPYVLPHTFCSLDLPLMPVVESAEFTARSSLGSDSTSLAVIPPSYLAAESTTAARNVRT